MRTEKTNANVRFTNRVVAKALVIVSMLIKVSSKFASFGLITAKKSMSISVSQVVAYLSSKLLLLLLGKFQDLSDRARRASGS